MSCFAYVDGIGLLGPGLGDWPGARAVFRGEAPYLAAPTVLPAPLLLPPAERRRAGRVVKLALAVAGEASACASIDPCDLESVFTSSGGDGQNCHELCETLATSERAVSPTRFSNSVHNAAAGNWSIATGALGAASVLCAHDASFGAGLLEALAVVRSRGTGVLLAAYDVEYPPPLFALRPIPDAFGIALVLRPERGPRSIARIEAAVAARGGGGAEAGAATCSDPRLEARRGRYTPHRLSRRRAARGRNDALPLDRRWIEAHLAHAGAMCLLDEILAWNRDMIQCRTATHRAPENPLRARGRLGSACGIEYAAQAMALHGALVADDRARHCPDAAARAGRPAGYLASVRGVRLRAARLDDVAADLICTATRIGADPGGVLYEFSVTAATATATEADALVAGRATIVLR